MITCTTRYEVYEVNDGQYGAMGEDGKWTGLIGMIERGVCIVYYELLKL